MIYGFAGSVQLSDIDVALGTRVGQEGLLLAGVGIFAAGGLILLLAAMSSSFDPREAWSRVRWVNGEGPQRALPSGGKDAAEEGR